MKPVACSVIGAGLPKTRSYNGDHTPPPPAAALTMSSHLGLWTVTSAH